MERKIKILGIAPYDSLKATMEKVAALRSNIELTCFVGNLEDGASIVEKYANNNFDVIISRGGTAELIQERTTLPVINIPISVYDTLRAIKLSENYTNKHAIIGFPSITKNAHFLCDMFQYEIDIYTLHDYSQVHTTLAKLRDKGYQMILCDMITNSLAKQYNLSSILITSGNESIEMAFDQAVESYHVHSNIIEKADFLSNILNKINATILVFNDNCELLYQNNHSITNLNSNFEGYSVIKNKLEQYVDSILVEGTKHFYLELDQYLFEITGTSYDQYGKKYVLYFIETKKNLVSLSNSGIHYLSKENIRDNSYDYFNNLINSNCSLSLFLNQHKNSKSPIVLQGEVGIEKSQFALLMYSHSELQNNPFIDIDCACLTSDSWELLMNNQLSPFNSKNTTINIRNIDHLSTENFSKLVNVIMFWHLDENNRIIFNFSSNENNEVSEYCRHIIDKFSCLTLSIPPLRQQINDIPNLSSLFLNNLNIKLGKEILGFEPGAFSLLTKYQWPGNHKQFHRVLNELATITTSTYIKTEDVKRILEKEESKGLKTPNLGLSLDLSKTLEEINQDIIQQVLSEENGNQSNAAKRLGISRSTLWRMMQKLNSQ